MKSKQTSVLIFLLFFSIGTPLFAMDYATSAQAVLNPYNENSCKFCNKTLFDPSMEIIPLEHCKHLVHEECFLVQLVKAQINDAPTLYCPACNAIAVTFKNLEQKPDQAVEKPSDEINECPYCLDVLNPDDSVQTLCLHSFHRKCWLEIFTHDDAKTVNCPLCRRILDKNYALNVSRSTLAKVLCNYN